MRHREEVINTVLAQVISGHATSADPEVLARRSSRPDVLMRLEGFRCVVEGRYESTTNVKASLTRTVTDRLNTGIAQIGIAVVYPESLRSADFSELGPTLAKQQFTFRVFSEAGAGEWHAGRLHQLMAEVRRAHDMLVKDDAVHKAAAQLHDSLEDFADLLMDQPAVLKRVTRVIGTEVELRTKKQKQAARMAAKIAGLTVANALIFQDQLASESDQVDTLSTTIQHDSAIVSRLASHWKWICDNINYVPIFSIAARVLQQMPASASARAAVLGLAQDALQICSQRAALRHDLMGRLYHMLLHEAKYLGTYYTSISAATLLLGLVFNGSEWDRDFSKLESVEGLRIADLACGTGTLLMAAAQAITDRFVHDRYTRTGTVPKKDLVDLHKTLIEGVLHGYDVVASAVHLTASTLSLASPGVVFNKMQLNTVPLGEIAGRIHLGSIDFAYSNEIEAQVNLFAPDSAATQVSGKAITSGKVAIPSLDLCVMNPPFTRSVGNNLLFGTLPSDERKRAQRQLAQTIRRNELSCNSTAGLGSVFVAVGDKYIRPGGRIALVLPLAVATGIAWRATRRLLEANYELEFIVSSHDPDRWNFSENTDLSEALIVARKKIRRNAASVSGAVYVNLWRNPRTAGESLALADAVIRSKPADIGNGTHPHSGVEAIRLGTIKYGEALRIEATDANEGWFGWGFAHTELVRCAWYLFNGYVQPPGSRSMRELRMVRLDSLGATGPDRRDIYDGFDLQDEVGTFGAVWGHDANAMTRLAVVPNKGLAPLSEARPGRNLRDAYTLWERAGTLLISERLRLNTQCMVAVASDSRVLSNTWWPIALHAPIDGKALCVWLNSSYGLLPLLQVRVPTEGSWIQLKKPAIEALRVPDLRRLNESAKSALAEAFDELSERQFSPLSDIENDPVRKLLDEKVASALELPDASSIRALLGREPVITGQTLAVTGPTDGEPESAADEQLTLSLM